MIEDTTLTQFCVAPLDKDRIVSVEGDETAYALESIFHGSYHTTEEETKALEAAPVTKRTFGYELDMEVDLYPYILTTYTAEKKLNARYAWGDHAPGEDKYQEKCLFKEGEKVLCVLREATDVVFPAVIVGPINKEYIRSLIDRDDFFVIKYNSVDEAVEDWNDWDWDSVIVRPLVRVIDTFGEAMPETVLVQRVNIFPYKRFEL